MIFLNEGIMKLFFLRFNSSFDIFTVIVTKACLCNAFQDKPVPQKQVGCFFSMHGGLLHIHKSNKIARMENST
jgi:hypothetical protein